MSTEFVLVFEASGVVGKGEGLDALEVPCSCGDDCVCDDTPEQDGDEQ